MSTHRITIELPEAAYRVVRNQVESGASASEDEAVIELILRDQGRTVEPSEQLEDWLRDTAVARALALRSDVDSALTSAQIRQRLLEDRKLRETLSGTRPDSHAA